MHTPEAAFLQSSLYNVLKWSVDWGLSPHANISLSGRLLLSVMTTTEIRTLPNVYKDLGVLMDSYFTPSIYCKMVASEARRILFIVYIQHINLINKSLVIWSEKTTLSDPPELHALSVR